MLKFDQDLPELSPEEQNFVELHYIKGLSASEAYRQAFDRHHWQGSAVWSKASHLKRKDKVQAWAQAVMSEGVNKLCETKEEHLRQMVRLREYAIQAKNISAAIKAEELIGKLNGQYVELHKDLTKKPVEDLVELLVEALGPEMGLMVAREKLGYETTRKM